MTRNTMTEQYDHNRELYLNMADEASAPDFDRADFDTDAMDGAAWFAAYMGLPAFDAIANIDTALDLVRQAENNDR